MIDRLNWLPHEGKWIKFTDAEVLRMEPEDQAAIYALKDEYDKNRLAHFLPHGQGREFLNDWTHGICMLVAPERVGKSTHGTIWGLLRNIPCDKRWPIFTENGVDWHEWRGPRRLVISSYSWDNVDEVWKEYQRWLPRYELGAYAPDWGAYDGENGKPKTVSFGDGRPKRVKLACGTELIFLCDGQSDAHWNGKRWDDHHLDEQREEEKFIGYLRGTASTTGLVQCCFTLTGHILDNRPDTGAGGWVKRKLWDGAYTYGKTVGRYKISVADTPECVLSKERKEELRLRWVVGPKQNNDIKKLRQAEAKYWGGWETGSGLCLDNFDRRYHLIPRFSIPRNWTLYRGIDHGRKQMMGCLWLAVAPWGDRVFYREHYSPGTIPANARAIATAGGSTVELMQMGNDVDTGATWPIYNEVFHGEHYFSSVMDTRSFTRSLDERNCTIGQFYNDCGLSCTKSTGFKNDKMVPLMNADLEIDRSRLHIMARLVEQKIITKECYEQWLAQVDGNPKCGSRQYMFSDLRNTLIEVEGWRNNPKTGKPMDEDDHLMSCWRFLRAEDPAYRGDYVIHENNGNEQPAQEVGAYKYVGS